MYEHKSTCYVIVFKMNKFNVFSHIMLIFLWYSYRNKIIIMDSYNNH